MDVKQFIDSLIPAAMESMKNDGIPASFTIAQAALESAWGSSKLAVQGFNLFGVKAGKSWKGDILVLPTTEFIDGKEVKVQAKWRKYESLDQCIKDHTTFLKNNPRYAPAFIHKCNGDQFAHYIAAGGYATDPHYAKKLQSIIYSNHLLALDAEEG